MTNNRDLERKLDALFRAYRDACPDVDGGPDFLPRLWAKIEAKQSSVWLWPKLARGFMTFAAAVSVLLAVFIFIPAIQHPPEYTGYIETLAETQLISMSMDAASAPIYVPPPREDRGL